MKTKQKEQKGGKAKQNKKRRKANQNKKRGETNKTKKGGKPKKAPEIGPKEKYGTCDIDNSTDGGTKIHSTKKDFFC